MPLIFPKELGIQIPIRISKVDAIGDVEELRAELHSDPFRDPEILVSTKIQLEESRTDQRVAAKISKRVGRWMRESGRIHPESRDAVRTRVWIARLHSAAAKSISRRCSQCHRPTPR